MCRKNGEIVDLLRYCEVARLLRDDVSRRLELVWVMPAVLVELLASWKNLGGIP